MHNNVTFLIRTEVLPQALASVTIILSFMFFAIQLILEPLLTRTPWGMAQEMGYEGLITRGLLKIESKKSIH